MIDREGRLEVIRSCAISSPGKCPKNSSNDYKITELKCLEHIFYQSILSQ